jgi:hypothetical protein
MESGVMAELMFVGAGLSAAGAVAGGNAQRASADFAGAQLDQQAGQARASSQRAAIEQRRQAQIANSRLQSLAGGSGLDPTVVHLAADIAGEGEYRALTALYEGEDSARSMEMKAQAARYEGKMAQKAGYLKAATSIISGTSQSMLDKYGGGGYSFQGYKRD